MYLIIKATPFKLSVHTVIEQSSVRKATLGVQRYMVLDGSAKVVDTRDGGIQLDKFKHMTSCGGNKAAIGRYVAIRWYQKPSPDACAISASNDLNEAIRDVLSSVAENKSCCHLIVDIGLMTVVRFYRPGTSVACLTAISSAFEDFAKTWVEAEKDPEQFNRERFNREYLTNFTSINEGLGLNLVTGSAFGSTAVQHIANSAANKAANISTKVTIGENKMKRIAIIVGNHVLSVPFTTSNLDLLMEADVLSYQYDSIDALPDCSTKSFFRTEMKTEIVVINQRDIKENPDVTAEREARNIEKLQAQIAENTRRNEMLQEEVKSLSGK